MASNRQRIQQAVAEMTVEQIRDALNKPELETDEAIHVRTWAARVELVEQTQIETADYVFGEPMGPINEMAFDLLAMVEHELNPRPPVPEPPEVVVGFGIEPPF